jgi:regulator of sigma E protease
MHKDLSVSLGVVRGQDTLHLATQVDANGQIGFLPDRPQLSVNDRYGFFQSIPAGIGLGIRKMAFYVLQLKLVFSKAGISSIGGFGAIGNLFPPVWDWFAFWMMTALLSIMLGVMNLLPVPALDGGHVLFLLYEVVSRRQPSEKFLEYAQMTGMALLIALLVYANGMDVVRWLFH